MSLEERKLAIYGTAIALRLALFYSFPDLPEILQNQVAVSTPISSFKRLREGLFLYEHNVSPYDGGTFHQAPLLLSLFSQIGASDFIAGLLYTLLDVLVAGALDKIAESKASVSTRFFTSSRKDDRLSGSEIAATYLFNPFTIAACLGRSTSIFTNSAIVFAISNAIEGHSFNAVLALSLASYLSLYPLLLFPPLAFLCWDRKQRFAQSNIKGASFSLYLTAILLAGLAVLLWTSHALLDGSWDFLASTYGFHLLVPDLTPNVGLWWYFLIEIFDPFRNFFLAVFWLHLVGYVGGLTIRLRQQPLFVLTTLLGIFAIFKPYPSISDVSLYFAFLPLYRHIFPLMRYTFVAVSTLLYATLLGPAFHYLWIYAGSGNANFFYAITLVWSLGLSILLADSLFALLRDEWEMERPGMKGKDVKRI